MSSRKIGNVTVYCSSSSAVPPFHFDAASDLGTAIAREGWTLIYGGNSVGLMKALADAVRTGGGRVVGVTPQVLVDKGIADSDAHELIITTNMRERKGIMEQRGDAFITMPGGLGTFEEIFEIIVSKQLGCHDKPIVLLNTGGYFNPLIAMLEYGIEHKFIKPQARDLYFVADEVSSCMEYLRAGYPLQAIPDKWFAKEPPSAIE